MDNERHWANIVLADKENEKAIFDYQHGGDRLIHFLVGQGMKATRGAGNPQMLFKMFKEKLDNEL